MFSYSTSSLLGGLGSFSVAFYAAYTSVISSYYMYYLAALLFGVLLIGLILMYTSTKNHAGKVEETVSPCKGRNFDRNSSSIYGRTTVDLLGGTNNAIPGRRCPACLEKGDTVWVVPGKCCPVCNTPVI